MLVCLAGMLLAAGTPAQDGRHAVKLTIADAIGPATADYLVRGIQTAEERGAEIVILQLDTPGGLTESTRDIIHAILGSSVPVAIWVAPSGSRAASAGTYMLYASHVAAMARSTHLGAATPVPLGGGGAPGEESDDRDDDTESGDDTDAAEDESGERPAQGAAGDMKAINDAVAYIRGLAELRGRNAEWAEKAVREAASLTSSKALEQNVIDLVANDLDDLLQQMDGRTVKMPAGEITLATAGLAVEAIEPDWRTRLLATITNPNIAYLLLIIGLYGLLLEGYNPGAIVPGVVGAISLLIAGYALQLLPVNFAGLALIILGVILIVAETFVASFGALGIGGVIALVIGSIILIDSDVPGFEVSSSLIGSVGLLAGLVMLGTLYLIMRSRRKPVASGMEYILNDTATAMHDFDGDGRVFLQGEIWNATATRPVRKDQKLRVTAIDGLHLTVEPVEGPEANE